MARYLIWYTGFSLTDTLLYKNKVIKMKSKVAISHNALIENAIIESCGLLGDLSALFMGKHVAIKPNDTWASPSDLTACTQADTVRAVIRYVKRFNPSDITISGGSGAAETSDVFHYLGIDKVIEEERVNFFDHNKGPFQAVELDYGPMHEVMINPHILEYDTIISLAQHKVHSSAMVTLSMKNIALSFPGADYYGHPRESYLHQHSMFKNLQRFITGMCKRFMIDLAIINGHPAMTGRGPVGGNTFESELVISSLDFVAADFIGAEILDIKDVDHIIEAGKIGLGNADYDSIDIAGIPLCEARKIFSFKNDSLKGEF